MRSHVAGARAWCVLAGVLGALASVLGKLAGTLFPDKDTNAKVVLSVVLYAAVVGCNVLMWSVHVRGLASLPSLQATAINFASNFLAGGALGMLLFHETLPLKWWLGASCISLGVLLLNKASREEKQADADPKSA
eukprot:jgi/Chlat1/6302/Chrsp44S09055